MTQKEHQMATEIIQEMAKREGVSVGEVRREMEACIDEAWLKKSRESGAVWRKIFPGWEETQH